MKLLLPIDLNGNFEHALATARYQRCWNEHQTTIVNSFEHHTGFSFKQAEIPARIIDGPISRAGIGSDPIMELSVELSDDNEIARTLIHELAHCLLIGNGIEPSGTSAFAESRHPYHMHRHIDLFLYDSLVDILGREQADLEVATESKYGKPAYKKAWDWALAMNYAERQQALLRLKKRYQKQREHTITKSNRFTKTQFENH